MAGSTPGPFFIVFIIQFAEGNVYRRAARLSENNGDICPFFKAVRRFYKSILRCTKNLTRPTSNANFVLCSAKIACCCGAAKAVPDCFADTVCLNII